ncbi:hypothetical protein A33M_3814 [Rhodovulum sp. PH10]|nr:hypothetical protein A33M_3814 [Rhodovulum sp. PH10]
MKRRKSREHRAVSPTRPQWRRRSACASVPTGISFFRGIPTPTD